MGCIVRNQGLPKPKTVRIPFWRQFKQPMLNKQKTMTSRNEKYGDVGYTFEAFGATFEILSISKKQLQVVAFVWYREEGFKNPYSFIKCWEELHPRKGYVPEQKVWVHVFEKLEATP